MAFWQAKSPPIQTIQDTDYTPAGRTCKDASTSAGLTRVYVALSTGPFSGSTNIGPINGNTDAHSNGVVLDKNTGLFWSSTPNGSIYGTGAQDLLWDDTAGNDEDIFEYCDQANTAGLSGFSDWRLPTIKDLSNIVEFNVTGGGKFPVEFADTSAQVWTSQTALNSATNGIFWSPGDGRFTTAAKTTTRTVLCRLVR